MIKKSYLNTVNLFIMKPWVYGFGITLICSVIQCSQKGNDSGASAADTTATGLISPNQNNALRHVEIIVKDSTQYSKEFLQGLREKGPGSKFELIDNLIITDGTYRNDFGQVLPDQQDIMLKAARNGNTYHLNVKQVNLTTISYDLLLTDSVGQSTVEKGFADRSPQFMLGSETDEDESHQTYAVTEYFTRNGDCLISIRLGKLNGRIVGQLSGCNSLLNYYRTLILL